MRILLVEDEHKIARVLKKSLEQETYAVDVAFDGDDAFSMATTEPYDAMIVDRMIPGSKDGIKLVQALREKNVHTPIIFLSALGSVEDRTTGLDAGADDYLVKPFALEELFARIRALLRRPNETEQVVLQVGDLTLNTVTFAVVRAERDIQLTSKEFSLLEFLMRNPGRPLAKDVIISHVWDYDADILPNTVEVYIKYLRAKIDEPFDTPLIHTVRGFGYKIEAK